MTNVQGPNPKEGPRPNHQTDFPVCGDAMVPLTSGLLSTRLPVPMKPAATAPMLIGRMAWKPRPGGSVSSTNQMTYWMIGGLCLMFFFSLTRVGMALRRSFLPRKPSLSGQRPNDEIAPEELARFLGDEAEGSYRSIDGS